jgi:hypothetical protein
VVDETQQIPWSSVGPLGLAGSRASSRAVLPP